jgi:sensor domain DACNK-containing protein/DisA checkpoint controller-like protein
VTAVFDLLLEEVDAALRPAVHERRTPSTGTIVEPGSDPDAWPVRTQLDIVHAAAGPRLAEYRRFADGLSSWLLRRSAGGDELLMFDRPASSERDLMILAAAFEATIVQRHPSGVVRVAGDFGVLRTQGLEWHFESPIDAWLDVVLADGAAGDPKVLRALLEFAVHDLGAQGIGALLIYRPVDAAAPPVEERLPVPPELHVCTAYHLAPLRHALAQVDGAAVFDAHGVLRRLGVRVVPSGGAEDNVDALGGTRHTAAVRYSYDDPDAIVIAVSDDGPVTVFARGAILGQSAAGSPD